MHLLPALPGPARPIVAPLRAARTRRPPARAARAYLGLDGLHDDVAAHAARLRDTHSGRGSAPLWANIAATALNRYLDAERGFAREHAARPEALGSPQAEQEAQRGQQRSLRHLAYQVDYLHFVMLNCSDGKYGGPPRPAMLARLRIALALSELRSMELRAQLPRRLGEPPEKGLMLSWFLENVEHGQQNRLAPPSTTWLMEAEQYVDDILQAEANLEDAAAGLRSAAPGGEEALAAARADAMPTVREALMALAEHCRRLPKQLRQMGWEAVTGPSLAYLRLRASELGDTAEG